MVTGLIIVYFFGVATTLFLGFLFWGTPNTRDDKRAGARLVLFCWAWPVLVAKTVMEMLKEMREELK